MWIPQVLCSHSVMLSGRRWSKCPWGMGTSHKWCPHWRVRGGEKIAWFRRQIVLIDRSRKMLKRVPPNPQNIEDIIYGCSLWKLHFPHLWKSNDWTKCNMQFGKREPRPSSSSEAVRTEKCIETSCTYKSRSLKYLSNLRLWCLHINCFFFFKVPF